MSNRVIFPEGITLEDVHEFQEWFLKTAGHPATRSDYYDGDRWMLDWSSPYAGGAFLAWRHLRRHCPGADQVSRMIQIPENRAFTLWAGGWWGAPHLWHRVRGDEQTEKEIES